MEVSENRGYVLLLLLLLLFLLLLLLIVMIMFIIFFLGGSFKGFNFIWVFKGGTPLVRNAHVTRDPN